MWTQYIATTTRTVRDKTQTSAVVFWKNEHDEIADYDERDMKNFLLNMSRGHEVYCDTTGTEIEDE